MPFQGADKYRQVADLHISAIGSGFLSTLGPRFLALLYECIDESSSSVLIVETSGDGRVVGFVSGGISMRAIYRCMAGKPWRLIVGLLPAMGDPTKWRGVIDILRRPSVDQGSLPEAELMTLAVAEPARGSGVAARLYIQLKEHFAAMGMPAFKIMVGESLDRAHAFYLKMGARAEAKVEFHRDQVSVVYLQPTGASQPDSHSV